MKRAARAPDALATCATCFVEFVAEDGCECADCGNAFCTDDDCYEDHVDACAAEGVANA